MKIKYCVSAIGYDKFDCVTDYEKELGEFVSVDAAREQFYSVIGSPKAYLKPFDNMGYWIIQFEKCEVTEDNIECTDVINEAKFYEEDLK